MTKEEIAADRAVCDAATKGPFFVTGFDSVRDDGKQVAETFVVSANDDWLCRLMQEDCQPDAEFFAAARTRWPAALDEIERLRAALARLACRDDYFWAARWAQAALDGLSFDEFTEMDRLQREAAHAERIAAQSELPSRKAEK